MKKYKTKKQLAEDLHMNVKTMREKKRYSENLEIIKCNIGEDGKKFEEIIENLSRNKKEKISNGQIAMLAELPLEVQRQICKKIVEHPENAKRIVNNWLNSMIKTTVQIPALVNEWLGEQAVENGLSKGKYIAAMLIDLYKRENEE